MLALATARAPARIALSTISISRRQFSSSLQRRADVAHAVIGGGVVGLAIARQLAERGSTVLLERHGSVGTETSSRNSEVIHAGLYYPPTSLKTKLCIRGKTQLYALCQRHGLPHRNVGKWIVAQDDAQADALTTLHQHAAALEVPTHFLSLEEAKRQQPDVYARTAVLVSPSTGIVDVHGLMGFLQEDLQTRGGDVALMTAVTGLERETSSGEYIVHTATGSNSNSKDTQADSEAEADVERASIRAATVINAAGLTAVEVSNMLLPPARQRRAYFAKGTYFSYSGRGARPSVLVYPAPTPGAASLGTHLTLDLATPAGVRFGPDLEWIDDPNASDAYAPSEHRLLAALDAIQQYLPSVDRDKVHVDYCGIRPKLKPKEATEAGKGFQDFVITLEQDFPGFVNLLGIESPGLTSALAIAEEVEALLYR